eukprot:2788879-Rhodomonas_salina.1
MRVWPRASESRVACSHHKCVMQAMRSELCESHQREATINTAHLGLCTLQLQGAKPSLGFVADSMAALSGSCYTAFHTRSARIRIPGPNRRDIVVCLRSISQCSFECSTLSPSSLYLP